MGSKTSRPREQISCKNINIFCLPGILHLNDFNISLLVNKHMNIIYVHDIFYWFFIMTFFNILMTPPAPGQEPDFKFDPVHFTNFETWFFEYPNSNKVTIIKTRIKIILIFLIVNVI